MESARILQSWRRLAPRPGGKLLFSLALSRFVRYTGSIRPRVRELEPDFLHATRRLCGVVLQQDRRQDALSLCREVYDREASRENRSALVVALAARDESGKQPTEAELEEALEHASILLDDPDVDEWAVVSACQAAAASSNTATLSRCYGRLQDVSPDHDLTHYVGWLLPMLLYSGARSESAARFRERRQSELMYRFRTMCS